MIRFRSRNLLLLLLLLFFLFEFCLFLWFIRQNIHPDLTPEPKTSSQTITEHRLTTRQSSSLILPSSLFNESSRYTFNLSNCWTGEDYHLWKKGRYFPSNKSRGNIVYMIMTGNPYLRSRCDVMMCTFGVTLHPSRLFFVGETSYDSRLPIYDVIKPGTRRPIDRAGSMQKLAEGLALVIKKINEKRYENEIEWIMVMDDDTFVSPSNLQLLALQYDAQRSLIIGQSTCGVGFCGGAGYLISKGLFKQLSPFIKQCRPLFNISQSDQFVPLCIKKRTHVEFINRKEFNSQPPEFYLTEDGFKDHPDGFGRAVTFHYMRPAEEYVALWRIHQAFLRTC